MVVLRRVRHAGVLGTTVGLLVSMVVVAGPAAAAPSASLALDKEAFVSGTETPLTSPVTPGGAFDYQLSAACSGLTQRCIGAATTDVLPPGVDFAGFDPTVRPSKHTLRHPTHLIRAPAGAGQALTAPLPARYERRPPRSEAPMGAVASSVARCPVSSGASRLPFVRDAEAGAAKDPSRWGGPAPKGRYGHAC